MAHATRRATIHRVALSATHRQFDQNRYVVEGDSIISFGELQRHKLGKDANVT